MTMRASTGKHDDIGCTYCVKCRKKTATAKCEVCVDKTGRRREKGHCKVCDTKKSVYLPKGK